MVRDSLVGFLERKLQGGVYYIVFKVGFVCLIGIDKSFLYIILYSLFFWIFILVDGLSDTYMSLYFDLFPKVISYLWAMFTA